MISIVTTRFNEDTWRENVEYRMRNNIDSGCIYGSPHELSSKIHYGSIVFVLEMNNTTNLIEGIGLIKNMPCSDKYYSIHSDCNYNRYIYKSNYRIDRSHIVADNKITLLNILEYLVFYEKTHLKRGSGFTIINQQLIKKKHHEQIKKIDVNKIIKSLQIIFKVVFNNI
jgi:hypothetical protein